MSTLGERLEGLVERMRLAARWHKGIAPLVVYGWADELAAALVAEGQESPPDDGNVWSQVRRLNEIRLRALVTPGDAIFNADDARFLLSLIEVRDRAFKELTRLTAERAAALPLQRTLPDEQFKGVVAEAIGGAPQLDNWVAEFSLTDESDVLDEFTLDEQAKIWGLMRIAWNTALERASPAGRAPK